MLKRTILWTISVTVVLLSLAAAAGVTVSNFISWRAGALVMLYCAVFVLARYAPGVCMYRLVVLDEPHRHFQPELERARSFAVYVGKRLLFAGLIFTLADIAGVLAHTSDPVKAASALSMSLLSALYALVLYGLTSHAARAAVVTAGH